MITRTTYQGLTELQGLLWRYLSVAFPGTTYSGGDMTFRVGGKVMPFGRRDEQYENLLSLVRSLVRSYKETKERLRALDGWDHEAVDGL